MPPDSRSSVCRHKVRIINVLLILLARCSSPASSSSSTSSSFFLFFFFAHSLIFVAVDGCTLTIDCRASIVLLASFTPITHITQYGALCALCLYVVARNHHEQCRKNQQQQQHKCGCDCLSIVPCIKPIFALFCSISFSLTMCRVRRRIIIIFFAMLLVSLRWWVIFFFIRFSVITAPVRTGFSFFLFSFFASSIQIDSFTQSVVSQSGQRKEENVNYMICEWICIQGADNLIIIFILIYTHNCLTSCIWIFSAHVFSAARFFSLFPVALILPEPNYAVVILAFTWFLPISIGVCVLLTPSFEKSAEKLARAGR